MTILPFTRPEPPPAAPLAWLDFTSDPDALPVRWRVTYFAPEEAARVRAAEGQTACPVSDGSCFLVERVAVRPRLAREG